MVGVEVVDTMLGHPSRLLVIAVLTLFLAACGKNQESASEPPDSSSSSALEKSEISLGNSVTGLGFMPVYVAVDQGFFEKHGLKVNVSTFKGGTEALQAVAGRAVDIGIGGITEPIDGMIAGQNLKAFLSLANQPIYTWWASPDIETVQDLKDRHAKIAVSTIGSISYHLTRYALQRAGLDPDQDVEYVAVTGGGASQASALIAGQVDATPTTPPSHLLLADQGFNLLIQQRDFMSEYPWEVAYTTEEFIEENPKTVRAFAQALLDATEWAKSHVDEAADITIETMKIGDDLKPYVHRVMAELIDGYPSDGHFPEQGITLILEFFKENGEIEEIPELTRILEYSFVGN